MYEITNLLCTQCMTLWTLHLSRAHVQLASNWTISMFYQQLKAREKIKKHFKDIEKTDKKCPRLYMVDNASNRSYRTTASALYCCCPNGKMTIKWVHRHSFFGAKAVEMKVFYDTLISRSLRRISSSICWSVFRGGIECVLISVMCGMMLRGTLVMFQLSSGVRYSIIWLRVSCVVPNRNGNPLTFANRSSK